MVMPVLGFTLRRRSILTAGPMKRSSGIWSMVLPPGTK